MADNSTLGGPGGPPSLGGAGGPPSLGGPGGPPPGMPMGALPPPPGVIPNFIDPYNVHKSKIVSITIGMAVTSNLFLLCRFWTRAKILKAVGWDDFLLLLAGGTGAFLTATPFLQLKLGLGLHTWDVLLSEFSPKWLLINNISAIVYFFHLAFVKGSICILYFRLSPSAGFKKFVWANVVLVAASVIFSLLTFLLTCRPIEAQWDVTIKGSCADTTTLFIANGSVQSLTDLTLLLTPMYTVWKSNMPLRRRIAVNGIFAFGFFIFAVSIVRMVLGSKIFKSPDPMWEAATFVSWSTIEVHTAIICAASLGLKAFFKTYWPTLLGSDNGSGLDSNDRDKSRDLENTGNLSRIRDQELGRSDEVELYHITEMGKSPMR